MSRKNKRGRHKGTQSLVKIQDAPSTLMPPKRSESEELLRSLITTQQFQDTFQNTAARTGLGTNSLLNFTDYPLTRLTQNYPLLTSLYRNSWIIAKIIDTLAADMTKKGFSIQSDAPVEDITRLYKEITRKNVMGDFREGIRWGNLYGGAIGIMLVEGQEDFSQPLDVNLIPPNGYKGLLVIDRWDGVFPDIEIVTDLASKDRGYPKYYNVTSQNTTDLNQDSIRVHHTRVIRFTGRDLPAWEKRMETYWGGSVIEPVIEELVKRDNASGNIGALIFQANLKVFGIEDFGSDMGTMTESSKKELYNTVSAMNSLMSSQGMILMGKNDVFETKQYSFSGLGEIYELFMLDIAGASGMPATKIFGREPAGMSATGESDLQIYYDRISTEQEEKMSSQILKLLPVLCMSSIGYYPDDLETTWNSIRTLSDESKMDLMGKGLASVASMYTSGIWSRSQSLKASKETGDMIGMLQFISDEEIAEAEEEDKQANLPVPDLGALEAEVAELVTPLVSTESEEI